MTARRLLDRAYHLADQKRIEDAKHVLNAIIFNHPNNIEAWEFYLQLCSDKKELDLRRILNEEAKENRYIQIRFMYGIFSIRCGSR